MPGDIKAELEAVKVAGKRYACLLADPPWAFFTYGGARVPQRADAQHYPTMPVSEIAALPVDEIATPRRRAVPVVHLASP